LQMAKVSGRISAVNVSPPHDVQVYATGLCLLLARPISYPLSFYCWSRSSLLCHYPNRTAIYSPMVCRAAEVMIRCPFRQASPAHNCKCSCRVGLPSSLVAPMSLDSSAAANVRCYHRRHHPGQVCSAPETSGTPGKPGMLARRAREEETKRRSGCQQQATMGRCDEDIELKAQHQ
jgi:hypothetical protein